MVLTLATTAAAGSSLSCLFSGSAAAATITAIPAAATATATTTAITTALAAEQNYPNKKISYGHFGRADPPVRVGLIPFADGTSVRIVIL